MQDAVGDLAVPSSTGSGTLYAWRLVNGFWGLVSAALDLAPTMLALRDLHMVLDFQLVRIRLVFWLHNVLLDVALTRVCAYRSTLINASIYYECAHAQFLGFGLLLTSLALRRWREMRFGSPWLRNFLADYGVCCRPKTLFPVPIDAVV